MKYTYTFSGFLLETFFKNNPSFCSFSSPNQELNMRSWFVSCFALSMVAFLQACQARLPGPSGRIGPPGPIGRTGPPGPMLPKGAAPVKYCAISTKITTFLKQFRSVGLRGATGGGLRGRRVSFNVTCIVVNLYVLAPILFIFVNKIVLHNIVICEHTECIKKCNTNLMVCQI